MAYNPYNAINAIYNYKKAWDDANKSGDTEAKNKAAQNAQVFYKQLKDNQYGNVANELSSLDVSGAKYILDQYSAKNTGVDNNAYNTSMQGATDKNNKLAGYIDSDRTDVQGKYNDIYNYANSDVTKTDEYQSTFKNIMGKYDLSAMQGRNNAVASGGASNGGNIDSYAAANAMRQQAALTAQGQQIAHQAGLEAANARVANVTNILNNLGVYNSGTYDAMNKTIANDANIGQAYFENSETAKNNEVARLSEQASVTGYTPNEWTIKNDAIYNEFLNPDGSFKKEKEGVDIQALINNTTDAETKKKLAVVRARKMLDNYSEFGKYMNEGDVAFMNPQYTEARRQFDKQDALARDTLATESADNKYAVNAEKEINAANNQNAIDQLKLASQNDNIEIDKNGNVKVKGGTTGDDTEWTNFKSYFGNDEIINFLEQKLKPYFDNNQPIDQETLEDLIVGNDLANSKAYDIDVEEAREIIQKLNVLLKAQNPNAEPYSDEFLDNYTNRTWFNKGKGMKTN